MRDLNEVANRRPRSTLILGSQEENARIRELQQENIELQTSVAEYQSALELIMAKYREQVRAIGCSRKNPHLHDWGGSGNSHGRGDRKLWKSRWEGG